MPLLTTRRSQPPESRPRRRLLESDLVAVALAAAIALAVAVTVTRAPPTVDELTLSNDTEFEVLLAVRGSDEDGWLALPVTGPGREQVVERVVDQGERWEFEVRSQGRSAGRFTVDRAELEASDWRVAIPAEMGRRLADRGAAPSPD